MAERGTAYEGALPAGGGSGTDGRRVALVIGNAAYPTAPLRNPRNDAQAFAGKLRAVHPAFDVTLALDVGRDAMEDALEAFEAKLANCDTALLFFAGHGLQVKGINFLMPIDADIRQEIHLKRRAISLNEILDIMGRRVRSSSLVFLDACRDNPFARSLLAGMSDDERGRFLTRSGLAEVRAGAGSFVAFATAPDNVALDGAGANSPFTTALVKHMEAPNASINDVMIAVRKDVLKATGGRQEPWDQSSLRERFSFHNVMEPVTLVAQPPVVAPEPHLSETGIFEKAALEHWEAVKGTADPARLRAFLADYGTSRMGQLARDAMQKLATATWRKVSRRDEVAVGRFIEEFPGTREVAEASAALAKLQADREIAAAKAAKKAEPRPAGAGGGLSMPVIGGSLAVVVLAAGLAIRQPWNSSPTSAPEPRIAAAPAPEPPKVAVIAPEPAPARPPAAATGPKPGETFRDCTDCPEMVVVPAGSFVMGSPESEEDRSTNEGPQRRVTIAKPFAVGKFEVTFADWDACVAAKGCTHTPSDEGWGRGKRPVINVSWNDAKQYVTWLSKKAGQPYRLLTEAEWEYAARAATTTPFHFGATIGTDQANYDGNFTYGSGQKGTYRQKTIEVGNLNKPNAFGIHDMHGNVWEWVEDCYAASYTGAPTDGGKAPDTKECTRVLRGGSWDDLPQYLRSANRFRDLPGNRFGRFGFRLARTLNPTP